MSSDAKLPPYSEHPPSKGGAASSQITSNRIAGNVQTCSIKDHQLDYLKIVRESATSYYLCLSVDPAPIYRIEFVSDSNKVGDIQIFPAFDTTLPAVAAARLSSNPKSKSEPPAMICTSEPYLPDARWMPLTRAPTFVVGEDYRISIPIVTVPGAAPVQRQFTWRTSLCEPFFELWWDGPLPHVSPRGFIKDDRDSRYVFATVVRAAETGGNLIEIRRGGGLEFELAVVLGMFVILWHRNKQLV
ncbi:hypothetical protein OIDMADRAFT_48798 [Oidiodendron maius Zn]|uniref:Uncharacterized protein n=1 Tax=Oidiodendron maius (strain Zn) TaxID=913774 RepID=A0A0C3I1J8_OIDMZ|nr:hypothetical protein OIDMADRAFT_48798 [Oidiodendron maius Zn]